MKTIIVVLGMHRSGTSVLAGILSRLGINAGDNCIPGDSSNPRGYFEDKAIQDVNNRLLAAMGSNWDTLGLNRAAFPDGPDFAAIFPDACELVCACLDKTDTWFFKDPRTCRLLPFWQKVFRHLNLRDAYLISLRNPVSVAESLKRRNDTPRVSAQLLWLEHIMPAIQETNGARRVLVDYDAILADTSGQVGRICRAFGLTSSLGLPADIPMAVSEFVEKSLRHSHHGSHEVAAHPGLGDLIMQVFTLLSAMAHDEIGEEEFYTRWKPLYLQFEVLQPHFGVLAQGFLSEGQLDAVRREKDKAHQELSQMYVEVQKERQQRAQALADLEQLRSEHSVCGRKLTSIGQQLEQVHDELRLLEESHSWRLTRPLRIMGQWLRKIVRGLAWRQGTSRRSLFWRFARRIYWAVPIAEGRKLALKRGLQRALLLAGDRSSGAHSPPMAMPSAAEYQLAPHNRLCTSIAVTTGSTKDTEHPASDYVGPSAYLAVDTQIKAIAFYLPQYHPIPENDAWWGRGFTEWTNVSKAVPQFVGHYQPHLPGELGFYDLRLVEVQKRQIELARQYGIHGFCYYYYWFNGRKILQRPLENLLSHPELNFPFCLCWANESWSRRWDGLEGELLLKQNHGADDDLAFIQEIAPVFADSRYIRVGHRPLLILYRPSLLPDPNATAQRWRNYCRRHGVGEIALGYVQSFDVMNPADIGFDYAIEFPPNTIEARVITESVARINSDYKGTIYDYPNMVEICCSRAQPLYRCFRGVTPSWDNEARKPGRGVTFHGATPALYRQWLRDASRDMVQRHPPDEQLVFVNAWNEWAEGAHLEPDRRYGYAWLQATADALREFPAGPRPRKLLVVTHDCHLHGAQLIILNVCRRLHQQFGCELQILLCGEGVLETEFAQCGQTHRWWLMTGSVRRDLLQRLRAELYTGAICNTVVTGNMLPDLKSYGFHIIWMIHEMAGVIRQIGLDTTLDKTARLADQVVFPARAVCNSFQSLAPLAAEKILIRPQGLYTSNPFLMDRENIRRRVRHDLKISEIQSLVLAVGFGDRRKAPDLFVEAGVEIVRRRPDVHLLWVGDLHRDMESTVRRLVAESGFPDHFHFVARTRDVVRYFAAADLYLLTSREDPFPSVVLEALDAGLPVIGFAQAGGFAEIITPELGSLVSLEDTSALARAALDWLGDSSRRLHVRTAGPALITENFSHANYARDLAALCGCRFPKVSVVIPNYNYERYLPQRLKTVLDQTYKPAEIIFLDDCSTDESVRIARDILSGGAIPYRIIENRRNQGVFPQWLRGIEESAGELIWIAEADDLCEPAMLARLVDGFCDERVVLAYCQSRMIDTEGSVLADNYLQYTNEIDPQKWRQGYLRPGLMEIADSLIVKNTIPNVSAVLFRKPEIAPMRRLISGLKHAGDWMFYLQLLQGGWIYFVPESLNSHRRHRKSVTLGARRIDLYRELLLVQNHWMPRISINSRIADMVERTRQSTYEDLELADGRYLRYRDHPDLADMMLAERSHSDDDPVPSHHVMPSTP